MAVRLRLAGIACAALALAGCSGAGADPAPAPPTRATVTDPASMQPGQQVDPTTFYSTMQKALLAAKTYAMTMTVTQGGRSMTVSGVGDASDPRHQKADVRMTPPDAGGREMRMILDGRAVYMQMPGSRSFVQMRVDALSQAGGLDLGVVMSPTGYIDLMSTAVSKVTYRGVEDKNGERLHHYSLTIDPQKLQRQIASAAPTPQGQPTSLPYEMWVDDASRPRVMEMTMQGESTTTTIGGYGKPVSITAPPSASVTQMPGLSGPASSPATPAPTPTATR